ncbi:MAG TPA: hypothetical protein V6C69_12820 [Trichormus sp.]
MTLKATLELLLFASIIGLFFIDTTYGAALANTTATDLAPGGSLAEQTQFYINQAGHENLKSFLSPTQGGDNITGANGAQLPGILDSTPITSMPTRFPPTSVIKAQMPSNAMAMYLQKELQKHSYDGNLARDRELATYALQGGQDAVAVAQFPPFVAAKAQAEQSAQVTGAGNALGDMAKQQSSAAIDFCSKYLINFTNDPSNPWNKLRDQVFVPIGILLLLPGAVLSQMRAIVAAGSPVVGQTAMGDQVNCFDGILRSIIAVFLIPATYLVVNYGIDLSNSITYTLSSEYNRLFGSNMYNDAICAEIRAHPTRDYQENLGAAKTAQTSWPQKPVTDWSSLESDAYESKLDDPCSKTYSAAPDRSDELMPASAAFSRALSFGGNAALTTAWNVLCAFQMVYLIYLFLVGPVIAGLWVWPTRQLQEALPSWVEGCITICFWSLFWNTVILLMACFRGVTGETGTIMMSALNFLATSAVKYAFDFTGLVKAAGQEAAEKATQKGKGGGGKGGHKGGHKSGTRAGHKGGQQGLHKGEHDHPSIGTPHQEQTNRDGERAQPHSGIVASANMTSKPSGTPHGAIPGGVGLGAERHAGSALSVVPVLPALPPPSARVREAGHGFVGSAQIRMPSGQTYAVELGVDRSGNRIAAVKDSAGRAIGSLDLSQGRNPSSVFRTAAGDFKLSAMTTDLGHQLFLTAPDGGHGTLALHNFLDGGAPKPNPHGISLPQGATALADLPGTGTLVRQADGSLAVVSQTNAVHPLAADGPTDVDGTMVQVGFGAAPNGKPFMEVSQVQPSGLTDVAIYPQPINSASQRPAGSVPIVTTADGGFVAAGTNVTYDPVTSTFSVNGYQLPSAVVSAELLREASLNLASAGLICQELALPGVAQNLPTINSDPAAMARVQIALQGTGVDAETLYRAAVQGSPVDGVQVMSQAMEASSPSADRFAQQLGLPDARIIIDARTDRIAAAQVLSAELRHAEAAQPGAIHQMAQSLGVPDVVMLGASSNVFYAAQVMSADVVHYGTPGDMHQICAQMGVSDVVLSGAVDLPVAAAQLVAAEARQSNFFAGEVSAQLCGHATTELLSAAAINPIAAAQMVGVAAQYDPTYAQHVAETVGTRSVDSVTAAAYYPSLAAQMVAMEAVQSAPYASAIAQSLPNFDSRLITESATSQLAATQFAAAGAALDSKYAAQIAPAMHLHSLQEFNAVANNPILAAQALSAETTNNVGYSNYVAHNMHLAPTVVERAATNAIAAMQMVASESAIHSNYAMYAASALQISDRTIMQRAAHDETVAAQLLATRPASNGDKRSGVARIAPDDETCPSWQPQCVPTVTMPSTVR